MKQLNTKTPTYSGPGTNTLSFQIPAGGPFDLLINYGKGTVTYADSSRLEGTVELKTPYGDGGAYIILLSPDWRAKKDILSYTNPTAKGFTVECIGDLYGTADRMTISYITVGYVVR